MITLLNKFDDNYIMKEKDILSIISSYIKENNLEAYLKDVSFIDNTNHLGYYNVKTNELVLNDERIIKFGYRLFDKLNNKFHLNEDNYSYYLNFYYLYIIFHELTHINQKAKFEKSNNDDLFNYLYELCMKLHQNDVMFYSKNHDLFPMEIEANNKGFLRAYNLMTYTKLPLKECRVIKLQYIHSLIKNYERINNYRIITPIEKLLDASDATEIRRINELLDNSRLSKIERMNLGVGITPREYDSIIREKAKCLIKIK